MRKTISKALALLLVMALILSFAAVASAATTSYINQSVSVRSGPGTEYAAIGTLYRGDNVTVTGSVVGGWSQVQFSKYETGYVQTIALTSFDPTYYNSNSCAVVSRGVTLKVCSDCGDIYYATTALNVRSGPGTKYSIIGTLTRNQQVTRVGKSGNWYKLLTSDGTIAYASASYLKLYSKTTTAPTAPAVSGGYCTDTSGAAYYTTTALNVRSGPGTGYPVINTLSRGAKVTYMSTNGKWYQVRTSNGLVGYCHSAYLTKTTYSSSCYVNPNRAYYCDDCGRIVYYGSSCNYCDSYSYCYPNYYTPSYYTPSYSAPSGGTGKTYTFSPSYMPSQGYAVGVDTSKLVTAGKEYTISMDTRLYSGKGSGTYETITAGTKVTVTSTPENSIWVGVTTVTGGKSGYVNNCYLN